MSHIPREVIYTEKYEKELRAIDSDVKRVDEFVRGVEWEICRFPETGKRKDESKNVWGKPINDLPDQPPVVLYYTFNDQYIWFLSIRKFEHETEVNWLE